MEAMDLSFTKNLTTDSNIHMALIFKATPISQNRPGFLLARVLTYGSH